MTPDWHPLEERWCTSRYALTDLHAGHKAGVPGRGAGRVLPEYTSVASEMGPIFKGRWLPGRTVLKAIERGSQGVSSFLNRAFIMSKGKEEERKKWTQQMKHKAGQRDAVRVRQGQWNLAAGLPVGALGPVWPPCELGGGGMVLVTMEDLEAKEETADDEVEGKRLCWVVRLQVPLMGQPMLTMKRRRCHASGQD